MKTKAIMLLTCLVLLTGCTSMQTKIPQVAFSPVSNHSIDYEVIGNTEGTACKTSFALYPIPIFWGGGDAMQEANYKAVEAVPNADAIISPRIKEEIYRVGIWYKRKCVVIKGKAIKLVRK